MKVNIKSLLVATYCGITALWTEAQGMEDRSLEQQAAIQIKIERILNGHPIDNTDIPFFNNQDIAIIKKGLKTNIEYQEKEIEYTKNYLGVGGLVAIGITYYYDIASNFIPSWLEIFEKPMPVPFPINYWVDSCSVTTAATIIVGLASTCVLTYPVKKYCLKRESMHRDILNKLKDSYSQVIAVRTT